jgi:hypothetical protein
MAQPAQQARSEVLALLDRKEKPVPQAVLVLKDHKDPLEPQENLMKLQLIIKPQSFTKPLPQSSIKPLLQSSIKPLHQSSIKPQ